MSPTELEELVAPFRNIGAGVHTRTHADGSAYVYGIQCGRLLFVMDHQVALLSNFPELRAVGFQGAQISDDSLVHFSQLKHLESLDIDKTSISDKGLKHLESMVWLEYLHIANTSVTEAGVRDLQLKLPNCEICSDWT